MIDDLIISTGNPIHGGVGVNIRKRLINEKLCDSETEDLEQ